MVWTVEFTWLHKGYFFYHETVEFEAPNRILLMNKILQHIVAREHTDYHLRDLTIRNSNNPFYEGS